MAFSGFTEMFARFAKVLCFNVPSPFFSLSQFFVVSLHKIVKTIFRIMLFTEKIKDLRLHSQLPQRKLAAALDIDTATYCKIEKGERKARKEQVELLASVFEIDKKELLALWLADKVTDLVSDNGQIARNALSLAVENLEYKEQNEKFKSI